MTKPKRTYSSPDAFKQALEQHLRGTADTGSDFARKRQLLVFDRFLARIVGVFGDTATLKGGLVLELRLKRARTTKDVDLRLVGSADNVLAQLQEATRRDLGDFLTFEVGSDDDHPRIQNEGMVYEGLRFRGECRLAGKPYGQPFGVDVAFGDPILGEPEVVVADDVLAFAGITPPTLRLYPIETHIAEKLHAYTMPRVRPNTRVKDLPDLALLATAQPLESGRVRAALEQTFGFRRTHDLPGTLRHPNQLGPAPTPRWHAKISWPGRHWQTSRGPSGTSSTPCSRAGVTPRGIRTRGVGSDGEARRQLPRCSDPPLVRDGA